MAHMIETRNVNGNIQYSFAENGAQKRAWHGLGDDQQIFDRPMFVAEALKACHADYEVKLQPVLALNDKIMEAINNGDFINAAELKNLIVDNTMATKRTDLDATLGVVSGKYGVCPNELAFQFVDTLCSGELTDRDEKPVIETCGVLGKGERIFVTAKMPDDIIIDKAKDDRIETYVVITNSHDGTGAVKVMVTNVRVVCNNTLNWAMRNNTGMLSFRHGCNIVNRMDLLNKENAEFAYRTLNLYNTYEEHFKESLEKLKSIKLTERDINNTLAKIALSPENAKLFIETQNINHEDITTRGRNIFLGMRESLESGIGQSILDKGNALWALNGITTYYQNQANYKDDETKLNSVLGGQVYDKVQTAYNSFMSLAA